MSTQNNETPAGIIWGAADISKYLNRPIKSVYPSLERGQIPGARKIAGKWALNPKVFLASFEA
jgi:hypothetical protein